MDDLVPMCKRHCRERGLLVGAWGLIWRLGVELVQFFLYPVSPDNSGPTYKLFRNRVPQFAEIVTDGTLANRIVPEFFQTCNGRVEPSRNPSLAGAVTFIVVRNS